MNNVPVAASGSRQAGRRRLKQLRQRGEGRTAELTGPGRGRRYTAASTFKKGTCMFSGTGCAVTISDGLPYERSCAEQSDRVQVVRGLVAAGGGPWTGIVSTSSRLDSHLLPVPRARHGLDQSSGACRTLQRRRLEAEASWERQSGGRRRPRVCRRCLMNLPLHATGSSAPRRNGGAHLSSISKCLRSCSARSQHGGLWPSTAARRERSRQHGAPPRHPNACVRGKDCCQLSSAQFLRLPPPTLLLSSQLSQKNSAAAGNKESG